MDSLLLEALVPGEKQCPGVTALVSGAGLELLSALPRAWSRVVGDRGGGGCCPSSPLVPATPALGAPLGCRLSQVGRCESSWRLLRNLSPAGFPFSFFLILPWVFLGRCDEGRRWRVDSQVGAA